ncbi:UvrB/UvrC motif-containing protein [Paenalkalicoccus suaedae]|uniref:UvrB/UvrC motif-containing protein n=1 Tax=Paenalkalicoccus suaedae TaxID=2592382 RepID=A0A859F9Y2_9BACI|nr:UvrB/UvrC motif-containing protein [Paenalkalicoccus suaedae]QKS69670.1 UvrB/UvrC motif-containing protein [Paenalkalicoccus suaedae]
MLCQECQEREATLHFTKIINGEKTEFHICDVCAKERGDYTPGSNSFSIHQLLSGLLDTAGQQKPSREIGAQQRAEKQCPSCGMTYRQFAEIGRFGCADCYESFDEKLDPVLRRIHGGNAQHTGKVPKRKGKDLHVYKQIEDLKQKLQQLIAEEEFEAAATTRDEIRSLEHSLKGKGGESS